MPSGWTVAETTGTGNYGIVNDVAVAWPPDAAPLVIAVLSRRPRADAVHDEAVVAEAASLAAAALT